METSNLNSVVSSSVQNVRAQERSNSTRVERDRDENTAERVSGPRRGGQLAKALQQTLSQFGFNPPETSKGAPAATASQATDAANAQSAEKNQEQAAVQGFMYALVQALGGGQGNRPAQAAEKKADDESSSTEAVSQRGRKAYGDIESRLQNLVQSLSDKSADSSATSGNTSQTGNLESAFQNLAKVLESNGNTGSTKMPDIQTFIKTLQQNIQNAGSRLDSSGNLVNTIA